MGRLDGKTAFVTGAAGGLGRDIAHAFASEGAMVGMADINADLLHEAVAGMPQGKALPFVCDVSDRAAVFKAIDGFASSAGRLDVLVNNAVYFH